MEVRERDFRNQGNPPQSNQESSHRFTFAPLNSSHNTRNETPDQSSLYRENHYHGVLQLQQEQMEARRPRRESNPNPDPAQPAPPSLPPPSQPPAVVWYRECLKNHAASMGTHVLDGCGEFMPSGEEGSPEGLRCAACDCHRSFHRREVDGETQTVTRIGAVHNPPLHRQHHGYHHQIPPIMVAFGGAPAESSGEDVNMLRANAGGHMVAQPPEKRFRTKFTDEQKENMHDFAERIGWKIQKQDEQAIRQFCREVGLTKQVFKVWMHNRKQALKKQQP